MAMAAFYLLLLGLTLATVASQYVPGDGCCIRWNVDGTCCISRLGQCCGVVTPIVTDNIIARGPIVVEETNVRVVPIILNEVFARQGVGGRLVGYRGAANHHVVVSHGRDRHG